MLVEAEEGYWVEEEGRPREKGRGAPLVHPSGGVERWFKDFFVGKEHAVYLGEDPAQGPFFIALQKEGTGYRVLCRTADGAQGRLVPHNHIGLPWWRRAMGKWASLQSILRASDLPVAHLGGHARRVRASKTLEDHIVRIEEGEEQTWKRLKIGVVYVKEGQVEERDIWHNCDGSHAWEEFLSFLGERTRLQGFDKYLGGLDNQKNLTGTHSVFTEWEGAQIMFHVSTLLPFRANDAQQIERKKHIGNDVVVLVFKEGDTPYRPSTILSKQNHVILVVRRIFNASTGDLHNKPLRFRVACAAKTSVPFFGPTLDDTGLYPKDDEFRSCLLSKIINAQFAAYQCPVFSNKLKRFREADLQNLLAAFL